VGIIVRKMILYRRENITPHVHPFFVNGVKSTV